MAASASASSSSSAAAYEYEAPAPLQVPSSGIFRFGDRRPMDFSTESRAEFVARALTQPKSVAERVAEVAANNKSKLPFDDRGVYLTSDSRAHYTHWGEAYRPENMAKASTVGGGTTIVLGHNHPAETCAACRRAGSEAYEAPTSQHRASFHKMEMPVELSKEERAAAIAVTRSGAAILKVFGKRPPEGVSAMEAGNRHMLAAPPTHDVPGAGGDGKVGSVDGKERAKLVSIQLGYFETDHATEYRANMVDYAAGLEAAASPYRTENRVHEVDPSKQAGKAGEDEAEAWKLRVVDDKTGEMKCEAAGASDGGRGKARATREAPNATNQRRLFVRSLPLSLFRARGRACRHQQGQERDRLWPRRLRRAQHVHGPDELRQGAPHDDRRLEARHGELCADDPPALRGEHEAPGGPRAEGGAGGGGGGGGGGRRKVVASSDLVQQVCTYLVTCGLLRILAHPTFSRSSLSPPSSRDTLVLTSDHTSAARAGFSESCWPVPGSY